MTPTNPPWLRVKSLFEEALDLPEAEREAFVASADCDSETRAELRSLLLHHAASSISNPGRPGFMDGSAALVLTGPPDDGTAESLAGQAARVGQRLGAWEIVRPIGSGGMGEVFEARRADGSTKAARRSNCSSAAWTAQPCCSVLRWNARRWRV